MQGNTASWRLGASVMVIAAAWASVPASAQTATEGSSAAEPVATRQEQTAAAEEQTGGLQDIIVTAQRREENLQRAAIAVSAVTGGALINAGVSDVNNLSKLVPSLVVQPSIGSSTNFYLRGVGSLAANSYAENPIAFNFNGVYIARPAAPIGTFYDLERVEIVKGPQGTLYGRNATGGAINVLPARPRIGEAAADLTVEYGNYDAKKATGSINVGLGDKAALRLAAQVVDRDPYLSDGYDDDVGQAARASLLFRPTDRLRAVLVADYFRQRGNGAGSVLARGPILPGAPPASDRIGGADPRSAAVLRATFPQLATGAVAPPQLGGYNRNDFWGVTLEANADFNFGTLTVLPSYRRSSPDYLSYNGGYSGQVKAKSDQIALEVRLASQGDSRFGYVIGAYLFDEQQHEYSRYFQGLASDTRFTANVHNNSKAAFGQLSFELFDGFRLIGGGRYTKEEKDQSTTLNQLVFGVGPVVPIVGQLSFDAFTYKGGVEFQVTPTSLLYGNVSTGFKSGGFFVAVQNNTFKPEHLTAFTLGSKNRFFDNRLQVNLEAFYWKYRDQQINYIGAVQTSISPVLFGAAQQTANVGRSRLYGAEAEVRFSVTRGGIFGVDLLYNNTRYDDFVYNGVSRSGLSPRNNCAVTPNPSIPLPAPARAFVIDCTGRPLVNAPKWTANISYEQRIDFGNGVALTPGARTRLESSRFLSLEYLEEQRQKAYRMSDAFVTLSFDDDRYAVTGFVNNIENRTVYAASGFRTIIDVVYNILRPPRTYGVRLSGKF